MALLYLSQAVAILISFSSVLISMGFFPMVDLHYQLTARWQVHYFLFYECIMMCPYHFG